MDLNRFPAIQTCPRATEWLQVIANLGLAENTLSAYARGLQSFLAFCEKTAVPALEAGRGEIAGYVRSLFDTPSPRTSPSTILSNATVQQRITAVRLFFDFLIEEGARDTNPVGRGRYTPNDATAGRRGLVPRYRELPRIPTDVEWKQVIECMRKEPSRNRLMFLIAYDCALRREELCTLHTGDLDPALRLVHIRAEVTKTRYARVLPYSRETGLLLKRYLEERRKLTTSRGPLFISTSNRNLTEPISIWTWSKVIRKIARQAGVARFTTHTLRHMCLTDLARAGWEIQEIAQFAGHRSIQSTLLYIHLSGRDLAAKIADSMSAIHASRIAEAAAALH